MRFARIFNIIFCVFFAALLLLPLFFFNFKGVVSSENRMLTAFPSRPKNFAEVPRFTNGIETWLNDRIGFRNNLVALCRYIEVYGLGVSPSKIVALGEKGTAFLLRAEQSTIKYEEVREALGETGDGKSLYDSQLAVLQRNAEAIEKSPYNTVVLAVPTAPLFRFDDLPKYVRMTVSRKTPMDHPVSMAMKTFEKVNPEGCRHFFFPLSKA